MPRKLILILFIVFATSGPASADPFSVYFLGEAIASAEGGTSQNNFVYTCNTGVCTANVGGNAFLPITSFSGSLSAQSAGFVPDYYVCGQDPDGNPILCGLGQTATASLSGSVGLGVMSAFAGAQTINDTTPDGAALGAQATALVEESWRDTVTISTNNPALLGTAANILVSFNLSGSVSGTPGGPGCPGTGLSYLESNTNGSLPAIFTQIGQGGLLGGCTDVTSGAAVWQVTVGQSYIVGADLTALAEAVNPNSKGSVDPPQSTLYLDPQTAGIFLASAGGSNYSTPTVPEPSSIVLLVTGLAIIGGLVRRSVG